MRISVNARSLGARTWRVIENQLVHRSSTRMSISGCGSARGQSVPFRADRIPLTPHTNTLGPYGPPRLPGRGSLQSGSSRRGSLNRPGSVTERPVVTAAQQASNNGAGTSGSPTCLQQILDELRQGREEQRKFRDDIKKMGHLITRLEEEYRKLNDQLKQQTDAAFSVETSGLKVNVIP